MRSLGFFVLWLVGSAVAVSVAFAGIAVVDDELVNPPPAQVSNVGNAGTDDTGPLPADPSAPADVPSATADVAATPPPRVSAAQTSGEPAISEDAPPTPVPPTPAPPTPVPPTPAPPTPAPPTPVPPTPAPPTPVPPTPVPPTPEPTATPGPSSTQVLTFNLIGGSTAISFSETQVEVLWASPNPGFEVDVDAGDDVRVEFESDDHRSRLDAWWVGSPQHEIQENAD